MSSEEDNKLFITDNSSKKQFELVSGGYTSRIEYMLVGNKIFLTHTEVPAKLEGKGIGSKIVKLVLEEIESRKLKLIPLCPFVAKYISKHPEWKRILDDDVKIL